MFLDRRRKDKRFLPECSNYFQDLEMKMKFVWL